MMTELSKNIFRKKKYIYNDKYGPFQSLKFMSWTGYVIKRKNQMKKKVI